MAVTEPEHERLIRAILAHCQERDVIAGIYCGSVELTVRWIQAEYRMLAVNFGARLVRRGAAAELGQLRSGLPRPDAMSRYVW